MIYLKWLALCIADWLLLLTVPLAAPVIAAFTREQLYGQYPYSWGWVWGTYDNPPQGDEGYVRKRSPFPTVTTGLRGYVNRVAWMIRNPVYGFARHYSLKYNQCYVWQVLGHDGISDKNRSPGWYFVRIRDLYTWRLVGFEFYGVFPYTKSRDVRIRLGWKMFTDKFEQRGFAPLVNTINPFDGYGDQ